MYPTDVFGENHVRVTVFTALSVNLPKPTRDVLSQCFLSRIRDAAKRQCSRFWQIQDRGERYVCFMRKHQRRGRAEAVNGRILKRVRWNRKIVSVKPITQNWDRFGVFFFFLNYFYRLWRRAFPATNTAVASPAISPRRHMSRSLDPSSPKLYFINRPPWRKKHHPLRLFRFHDCLSPPRRRFLDGYPPAHRQIRDTAVVRHESPETFPKESRIYHTHANFKACLSLFLI